MLIPYILEGSNFNGKLEKENLLTFEIVNWLREQTLCTDFPFIWFHVANEFSGTINKFFGARLRALGKLPGIPDLIFMAKDKCILIEIKFDKGKLSKNQVIFKEWAQSKEIPYFVVYSLNDVKEIINENKNGKLYR